MLDCCLYLLLKRGVFAIWTGMGWERRCSLFATFCIVAVRTASRPSEALPSLHAYFTTQSVSSTHYFQFVEYLGPGQLRLERFVASMMNQGVEFSRRKKQVHFFFCATPVDFMRVTDPHDLTESVDFTCDPRHPAHAWMCKMPLAQCAGRVVRV